MRQTLDGTGAVVAATVYDPWGTPQTTLAKPFGFTGELQRDALVHLRTRWYAPESGTFTARDPFAGFAETPYSLHPYQYAYSAPTTWADPTGENPIGGGRVIATCLAFILGDAALPIGEAICIGILLSLGGAPLISTNRELLNDFPIYTPPLDPGPPEQPVQPGPQLQDLQFGDNLLTSPRTGPEEVCWFWPGPSQVESPWPVTTGAPLDEVQQPVVVMAGQLYQNRYPEQWPVEQSQAERLGIDPAPAGTPEWHETLTHNQLILWAVDGEGELIIMPRFVRGDEPAHTVLVNAQPVQAAGTAQIRFNNGQYIGEHIDGESGHYYQPGWPAETIGRRAFAQAGILFP